MYKENRLTRFERARIIGARSLQISMGAPVLVKLGKSEIDPTEIAVKEFKERTVPMTVIRRAQGQDAITVDISEADLETMLY
ncbi:TPA: DNA-directed RNA polymerase subunit K [archaeon]|jgi:DNA-directed RNA polymerase subunit K|uniref:DNA-directed RNA polymerase subunit Rpo6 n=1 Tax=Candidatus Undinarchaeum marinum TaxID=2756141 RepID=A0A832XG58_9ARCH|nr:DNA-directed RNA polymerase subunit K [Candidatus Undinarchaeum marinum]HIK02064.1 DNA-directed RNA polymerase subunit K [Candidatus Undinarchaeales archaeon SRR5007147.bin71]